MEADPGGTHAAAHERADQLGDQVAGQGDRLDAIQEKIDDLEALVHGTVTLILEDDVDEQAPPAGEKTTVVPRQDAPPADDKKPDDETPPATPPAEKPKRHSGLFT